MESRRILAIAGSDSSGGAGLEADQKVIAAHGCYAMTATTALTAQNTLGVSGIHHVPSDFVVKQIEMCMDDIGVDVVKIGMLASASTVEAVASQLLKWDGLITVLDPVMISTSGAQLLPETAIQNLLHSLLPHTTILTPNIPEARLLLETSDPNSHIPEITNLDNIVSIAKRVQRLGPQNVLVKGGHFPISKVRHCSSGKGLHKPGMDDEQQQQQQQQTKVVIDVLCSQDGTTTIYETEYVDSKNTHGTGCSLASAIASNIALGYTSIPDAVGRAIRYVEAGIKGSVGRRLGKGGGPIDHFHSMRVLNLPESSMAVWEY